MHFLWNLWQAFVILFGPGAVIVALALAIAWAMNARLRRAERPRAGGKRPPGRVEGKDRRGGPS